MPTVCVQLFVGRCKEITFREKVQLQYSLGLKKKDFGRTFASLRSREKNEIKEKAKIQLKMFLSKSGISKS